LANRTKVSCRHSGCPALVDPAEGPRCPKHRHAYLKKGVPCRVSGCADIATREDHGYCRKHKREDFNAYNKQRRSEEDAGIERWYSTAEWQALRQYHISREPLCRICAADGKVVQGVEVDHITPIRDGGARRDDSNLQTLCRSCHAKKTAFETASRAKSNLADMKSSQDDIKTN